MRLRCTLVRIAFREPPHHNDFEGMVTSSGRTSLFDYTWLARWVSLLFLLTLDFSFTSRLPGARQDEIRPSQRASTPHPTLEVGGTTWH